MYCQVIFCVDGYIYECWVCWWNEKLTYIIIIIIIVIIIVDREKL